MKGVAVVTVGLVVAVAAFVLGEGGSISSESDQRMMEARREERIFAFYTTTSIKRLATTTITAISTCLSITEADPLPTCNGRKRRSIIKKLESLRDPLSGNNPLEPELFGSKNEETPSVEKAREVRSLREGKKLTVWSSVISTLTLTSTSYLAGTTLTATALCIAPGVESNMCFGK